MKRQDSDHERKTGVKAVGNLLVNAAAKRCC